MHGLQSRPDLNGRTGVVVKNTSVNKSTTREAVKVDGEPKVSLYNANNLVLVAAAEDSVFSFGPVIRFVNYSNFFYLFGNTPARYLLGSLPSDSTNTQLMLLGCGDCRHVWYSLHCLCVSRSSLDMKVLACDIEPSIIARNIMFIHLIMENVPFNIIWSLFYCKRIESQKLLSYSTNLENWSESPISRFIAFSDNVTFDKVRAIWAVYARGEPPEHVTQQLIQRMKSN